MATVAELKTQADSLGVKYPSKIRKTDLETLVAEASDAAQREELRQIGTTPEREAERTAKPAHKVTEPMPNWKRDLVYLAQTRGKRHTPRQSRRIRKAENRAKGRD